ncbi:MAG: DNA translocase FtsK 4TM domain-containing protein, partial [Armatimonadota bacterium]
MSRRQRPSSNRAAAVGLGLVFLALLLWLSFLPGATGIPVLLAAWQRRLVGAAAPVLPFYVLFAGLVLIAAGQRARFSRRIAGLLLASVAALLILHLRTVSGDFLRAGLEGRGGGVIAGALAWSVSRVLGTTGLWVTSGALAAAALVMISRISLTEAGEILRASALGTGLLVAWVARTAGRLGVRALRGSARLALRIRPAALPLLTRVSEVAGALGRTVAAEVGRQIAKIRAVATPAPPVARPLPALEGPPLDLGAQPPALPETVEPATTLQPAEEEPVPEGTEPTAPPRRRRAAQAQQESLEFASVTFQLPPLTMLGDANGGRGRGRVDPAETARALEQTLASFGVEVRVVHWEVGPVVTRYEVQPAPGVKVQRITSLTNDIALNLAAQSVRIEAPIPGKSAVGIELPNTKASLVHLREIIGADLFQKAISPLVVGVGKDIAGHPIIADLAEMPHLLIAGATGSGKSVALNAMIASLLFRCTPQQVRFVMIDPKRVELTDYNDIPHQLTPVVTNPRQAASILKDMLRVMEKRFERFAEMGVRNIQAYNQLGGVEPLYYIVIIIDELADLMMVAPADFEDIICRLAQMTRATGIHLVLATQRPSVDVITGLIKANIPSRLAFAVSSQVDSRTILDSTGAEKLLGRGDMLFLPLGASRAVRAQGAYIADAEIRAVVEWWRRQGRPAYDQQLVEAQQSAGAEGGGEGERLIEAARLIVRSGYGSVSLLQRKMRIGYVTAARLIDELEARGIVGPVQGSNPREV